MGDLRLHQAAAEGDEERPYLKSFDDAREHAAARGIPPPSRAGWYRFLARMRKEEHLRLVYRVQGSGETANDLARETGISDTTASEAFRALSVNAAMDGDEKTAALYANAATMFRNASLKQNELEIKTKAQVVKEQELKLAQEKFAAAERRLEAVAAVADAARGGHVDSQKVADEIDRILGRKK